MTHTPVIHTDLSDESLIRVSGADAVPFLQGQLSTDLEKLGPGVSQFSSWSNAKGRVVTLCRAFRRGDDIYLALPASLQAVVQKKLALYVLRSKVALTDASGQLGRLGIAGDDAPALLTQAGLPVPAGQDTVTRQGDIQIIRLHGTLPRYALYGPPDAVAALREKFGAHSDAAWRLQKIFAGEPTVYPQTSERFVAQMLGLDELGAIDYKKGCYIGQEVIARAHYRGAVKRHLLRAVCEGTTELRPGDEIQAAGQDGTVAEVIDTQRDPEGRWPMLLVVQDDFRDATLNAAGAPVEIVD